VIRRWWLSVLLVVFAAIVWASPASAGTAAGRETRVTSFQLARPTLVRATGPEGAERRLENALRYGDLASGPRLRWKGRWLMYSAGSAANAVELYDMRARWWWPQGGVFVSVDDFRFHSSKTTLWGWPGQNPLFYSDPTGHGPFGAALGGLLGGAAGGTLGAGTGFVVGIVTGPGEVVTIPAGAILGAGAGATAGAAIGDRVGDSVSDFFNSLMQGRDRSAKPDGCPVGTVPIDQSGLGREKIHRIKPGLGQGPKDWTGVAPDGTIWGDDGTGNGVPIGHVDDFD
jgi:RHS repeat-associated protein